MSNLNPISKDKSHINLTYFRMRKFIGIFGVLLPVLVSVISQEKWPSISHYYYSVAGFLFVGIIFLVSAFLFAYNGYPKQNNQWISDNTLTSLGGFFILIVAIVPTGYDLSSLSNCPTPICHNKGIFNTLHFGGAVLFFACMSYLVIGRFTLGSTSKDKFSKGKKNRNLLYKFCGWGMVVVLLGTGVLIALNKFDVIKELPKRLIYIIEFIMLVQFGAAWLVKGKALADLGLQDKENE